MKATTPFSVCVYCGSRHGAQTAYTEAARQVGQAIGERGWRLVYGGGNVGLMGEVADATLAAGGQVVGVIPELLLQKEVGHHHLTELHVVRTMHERKQLMAEKAHAFMAMPGGIGTLEEIFEVWTWRHIGYHDQPMGLLNTMGYYDPLLAFLKRGCDDGFMDADQMAMLAVNADPLQLLDELTARSQLATGPDNYRRI
ncbi:MAG: TIGR00730 family Rossman fold protein [Vitreoscilla sp.]|nr:TIGR00730 family Rossman fold protein [Vitreoscilla sp.]MBP6673748.1 TIGR00730 family Rossman fold protein [Vitreoscilla sp.]